MAIVFVAALKHLAGKLFLVACRIQCRLDSHPSLNLCQI